MADVTEGGRIDVEIWTDGQRIQGKVFVARDKRLSDSLNDVSRFLSLTDVKILSLDGIDTLWQGTYLAINKSAVNVVRLLGDHDVEQPTFEVGS
jgi:hypothetical protein